MLTSRSHDRSYRPTVAPAVAAERAVGQRVTLLASPDDRHLYVVNGIGTLRIAGWTWRAAAAEAGGRSWQITRRGIWPSAIQATDAAGDLIGEFSGYRLHYGAALRWSNRELALRLDGLWHDRYVLLEDDRAVATIDGTNLNRRPLTISITDTPKTDTGLILFTIYAVHIRSRSRLGAWRDHRDD